MVVATNFVNRYGDQAPLADLVEAADLPCLVVGLGAQANDDERIAPAIPAGTIRFVRAVAERLRLVGGCNGCAISVV